MRPAPWPRREGPRPFREEVYRLVRRVPPGKVVTYGQVAAMLGRPRAARAVGLALGALRDELIDVVPWQRVIGAVGRPTHRDEFWGGIQRELLEGEGVRFDRRGRIDFERARWKRVGCHTSPRVARTEREALSLSQAAPRRRRRP